MESNGDLKLIKSAFYWRLASWMSEILELKSEQSSAASVHMRRQSGEKRCQFAHVVVNIPVRLVYVKPVFHPLDFVFAVHVCSVRV